MTDILVIFGPTASGKSGLALDLAERLGGETINADSRQVYRDVQRVTAGPSAQELARAPHHLFGVLDVTEPYSAGRWATDAARVVEDVRARGKQPIVVGGTGFYLKALMEGTGGAPPLPTGAYEAHAGRTAGALWRELTQIDPTLAQRMEGTAEQHNRQRLVRAVAVFHATGKPLSGWQEAERVPAVDGTFVRIGLNPPVEVLAERIEARWRALLAEGLLDEIAALDGVPATAPGLSSLTVPVWRAHLAGQLTVDEAVAAASQLDRQYAKRQRTWLRTQFGGRVFETGAAALEALKDS